MFASSSVVEPAERVTASSVRSRRRSSDSPSPSGTVASIRVLACTSGRSMTASTRLARLPGVMCPADACSDARTVPSAPAPVVTSAAATGWPSSSTSMCRDPSGLVMAVPPGIDRLYLQRQAEPGPIRLGLAQQARTRNRSTATDLATPPALAAQAETVPDQAALWRSEEHTSELQSLTNLVCRLLLEKKKI